MHRDLKLGNILLTESDSQVKIIDFGLAVKLEVGEKGE
jgi:serine/threonine protein kinase